MTTLRITLAVLLMTTVGLVGACGDDDSGNACNSDGTCDPGETPQNCAADCPICIVDGDCDTAAGETAANCALDCGAPDCDLSLTGDDHDYLVS